jgi:hypothetical protein
LISEAPFSRGHITVVDPLLARPAVRWGAVFGRLLAPLADALRELDDLAAFGGAMVTVGVHRARAAVTHLWPWALVALTLPPVAAAMIGAAHDDLSWLRFFFFFFLTS